VLERVIPASADPMPEVRAHALALLPSQVKRLLDACEPLAVADRALTVAIDRLHGDPDVAVRREAASVLYHGGLARADEAARLRSRAALVRAASEDPELRSLLDREADPRVRAVIERETDPARKSCEWPLRLDEATASAPKADRDSDF
jgi:hypothetical protein